MTERIDIPCTAELPGNGMDTLSEEFRGRPQLRSQLLEQGIVLVCHTLKFDHDAIATQLARDAFINGLGLDDQEQFLVSAIALDSMTVEVEEAIIEGRVLAIPVAACLERDAAWNVGRSWLLTNRLNVQVFRETLESDTQLLNGDLTGHKRRSLAGDKPKASSVDANTFEHL